MSNGQAKASATVHPAAAPPAAAKAPPPAVQGNAAAARSNVVIDPAGRVVGFRFTTGQELTQAFEALAQRLSRGGPVDDAGMRSLRRHAIDRRGTVSDAERMFIAGLLDAGNAQILRQLQVRDGASLVFPAATITDAQLRRVVDLDRADLPAGVVAPLAEATRALSDLRLLDAMSGLGRAEAEARTAIVAAAGAFDLQARQLVQYLRARAVSAVAVLRAMHDAASDNTGGDMVMTGVVYAVAADARHPMAGPVLAGQIKVDATIPRAFARLPGIQGSERAFYVTAARQGLKGDTVYVQTNLDPSNVAHRSVVIHELDHAARDRAASPTSAPVFSPWDRAELSAYRAQARYVLDQLERQSAAERTRGAQELAAELNLIGYGALVLEAHRDPVRYRGLLAQLFDVAPPGIRQSPAQLAKALTIPPAKVEANVLQAISNAYGMTPGQTTVFEGLAGESLVDWIFRI